MNANNIPDATATKSLEPAKGEQKASNGDATTAAVSFQELIAGSIALDLNNALAVFADGTNLKAPASGNSAPAERFEERFTAQEPEDRKPRATATREHSPEKNEVEPVRDNRVERADVKSKAESTTTSRDTQENNSRKTTAAENQPRSNESQKPPAADSARAETQSKSVAADVAGQPKQLREVMARLKTSAKIITLRKTASSRPSQMNGKAVAADQQQKIVSTAPDPRSAFAPKAVTVAKPAVAPAERQYAVAVDKPAVKADSGAHVQKADSGAHVQKADSGAHVQKADSGTHVQKAGSGTPVQQVNNEHSERPSINDKPETAKQQNSSSQNGNAHSYNNAQSSTARQNPLAQAFARVASGAGIKGLSTAAQAISSGGNGSSQGPTGNFALATATSSYARTGAEAVATAKLEQQIPVKPQQLIQQVIRAARIVVSGGKEEINMLLKPEQLGWLKIRLSVEGQRVTAHIVVENEAVRSLLESNLNQLQQALHNHNLKVSQITISLNSEAGSHTQESAQERSRRRDEQRPEDPGNELSIEDEIGMLPLAAMSGLSIVDLRV